eukprot:scaffold64647_cov19-Tisochrysis_lutea.AAC.1
MPPLDGRVHAPRGRSMARQQHIGTCLAQVLSESASKQSHCVQQGVKIAAESGHEPAKEILNIFVYSTCTK